MGILSCNILRGNKIKQTRKKQNQDRTPENGKNILIIINICTRSKLVILELAWDQKAASRTISSAEYLPFQKVMSLFSGILAETSDCSPCSFLVAITLVFLF